MRSDTTTGRAFTFGELVEKTEQVQAAITASRTIQGIPIGKEVRLPLQPYKQQTNFRCVPATVQMILSHFGVYVPQAQLAGEMYAAPPFGVHNVHGIAVLNRHLFGYDAPGYNQAGYRLHRVSNSPYELALWKQRLIRNIADGYPMYYTFEMSSLMNYRGEHNVMGCGYVLTPDGTDIAFFVYYDPFYFNAGYYYVTPQKAPAAMLACGEPDYAW